jgi:hypothetical protein
MKLVQCSNLVEDSTQQRNTISHATSWTVIFYLESATLQSARTDDLEKKWHCQIWDLGKRKRKNKCSSCKRR